MFFLFILQWRVSTCYDFRLLGGCHAQQELRL